jgi:hypothetical protein
LIARNLRELFSFNRGVSHINEACCINELSIEGPFRVPKISNNLVIKMYHSC